MKTVVLLDADPLVYRCGFAAEANVRRKYGVEGDFPEDLSDTLVRYSLAITKRYTRGVEAEVLAECSVAPPSEIRYFLSGSTNWRNEVATIAPYKGNRKTARPQAFEDIRQWLSINKKARFSDGNEADDEISIVACLLNSYTSGLMRHIIATIDKDLQQIPGEHYNFVKKKSFTVSPEQALINFYTQALCGDPVDNIPGCFRVGPKKAEKIITKAVKEGGQGIDLEKALWYTICEQYERAKKKYKAKCPHYFKTAEEAALETARLVFLQTDREVQLWEPPTNREEKDGR